MSGKSGMGVLTNKEKNSPSQILVVLFETHSFPE